MKHFFFPHDKLHQIVNMSRAFGGGTQIHRSDAAPPEASTEAVVYSVRNRHLRAVGDSPHRGFTEEINIKRFFADTRTFRNRCELTVTRIDFAFTASVA